MKTIANDGKDRVYYDTNIWVAYMLGEKYRSHHLCKPMIDAVEQEQIIVVVSDLISLELIHVIRRRVFEKYSAREGITASKIESVAKKITSSFNNKIGRFERQRKGIFVSPMESVAMHHSVLHAKLAALTGYAKFAWYCKKCQRTHLAHTHNSACPACDAVNPTKKYRYKGLGHADLEHVFFAIHGRASAFYTLDWGFDVLKHDPDFSSIVFRRLGDRSS